MSRDPASLLDDLLAARAAGSPLPTDDPDLAFLADLAETVTQSLQAVPPPPGGLAGGRTALLAAAAQGAPTPPAPSLPWWRAFWRRPLALAFATLAFLLLLSLGGGAVTADSLPGDMLYPLKRFSERVGLVINDGPAQRAELEQRRQQETHEVLRLRRTTAVEFTATIAETEPTYWLVRGHEITFTLLIDPATVIVGTPRPGATVFVVAETRAAGDLLARRLVVAAPPSPAPTAPPPAPTTTSTVTDVAPPGATPRHETVPAATQEPVTAPAHPGPTETPTPPAVPSSTPLPTEPPPPTTDPDDDDGQPAPPSATATPPSPSPTTPTATATDVAPSPTPTPTVTPRSETVPRATPTATP